MNSAAVSNNAMLRDLTLQWSRFWREEAPEIAGPTVRISFGDDWATARCARTGRLLDSFVIATVRDEITGRLAQLRLNSTAP